ncbi:MAG: NTP transferase domain-containing protein [Acidobacteriaceae bacterium]|nr:NTP transferase domain-containing protein [Acidobacteriaceae bacterium]MBV8572176.1 NTP transferase domain-containing protein [Acidobacteriaceae bacterium]
MGGITKSTPKAMLLIHGRPMLEHILEALAAAGLKRFLLVVGVQHELIEDYFRNWRLPIEFRLQQPVNGTGSAALLAEDFAGADPFLLTYGDIVCDSAAYAHCVSVLDANPSAAAVIGVKEIDDPWQGAAVYEEGGRIGRIVEKPPKGTSATRWNSAGIYGFRRVVFDYLARLQPSERNEYELTSALGAMLDSGLELRTSVVEGAWRDVGRPEDLAAVNE